jgi:hypothetical protein
MTANKIKIIRSYNNIYIVRGEITLMSIYRNKTNKISVGKYCDEIKGNPIVNKAIKVAEEVL